MVKINFENNVTKANAETFNTMQNNIENAINNVSITMDNAVSLSSENGVQNKVITKYVNDQVQDAKDYTDTQISEVQQDISNINDKLYDTGWVRLTITGTSVWERDNGATPRYRAEIRRIGSLVQVKGNLMANSNLSDNQSVSIPSASLSQFFTDKMELSGVTNNANWWVDSNGVFHISSSASSYININACYMWVND